MTVMRVSDVWRQHCVNLIVAIGYSSSESDIVKLAPILPSWGMANIVLSLGTRFCEPCFITFM
jgi:hypothetical protein